MKQNENKEKIELLKKISPALVLTTILIINILIVLKTPYILTGDELFYYDQAQKIKQGEFAYFDNTQPFAYPLLLASIPSDNVLFLRMLSPIIFVIGLYFLFKITEHMMNKTAGLLTITIAGLAKFSLQISTLMLTEALFVLTASASMWFFIKTISEDKNKNFIYLFFWLSLAIQTKITNLVIPFAFLFYLIAYEPQKFNVKITSTIILSILSLAPYLILTKGKFLLEKVMIENTRILPSGFLVVTTAVFYFTIPFVILLAYLLFFYKAKNQEKLFTTLAFLYIVFLIASKTILYPRHMYPFFFFLIPLIVIGVLNQKKIIKTIGFILIFIFIIINVATIQNLPEFEGNNYFFEVPENCVEIKELTTNQGNNITLPYFEQPSRSIVTYSTTFFTKVPLNTMSISYADEHTLYLTIDKTKYIDGIPYGDPEKTTNLDLDYLNPGYHTLNITILNIQNIGGIGQIIFCEDKTKIINDEFNIASKV